MEILKRMISALLAMVLVAGMLPVSAMAEEDTVQETVPAETVAAEETVPETTEEEAETVPEEPEVYTLEPVVEFYVNPLYTGEVVDILSAMPMLLSGDETTYYTDPVEIGRLLRPAMEARKTVVTMGYQIPTSEYNDDTFRILMRQAVDEAVKHTGVPTQGDYLLWQYEYMELSASGINDGTDCYFTLTFAISYYTTAEQEAQVDAAVASLLQQLDISGSDYDKISAVYDYITDNIVYDYKNLNDSAYMLKHTAYAALINGTSVCQGYALLLYRLALEMGIDCRIVTGTGNGEDHAWNLVKLGGKYYNVDATWDASRAQADMEYKYYLLPDSGFSDHVRDDAYRTAAFYAEYPMGTTAYTPGSGTEPTEPEETVPQETIPGETVPGETEPEDPNILTFSVSGDKNMSAPSQASISEKNSAIPSVSKVFDVEPSVTAPYATGKLSDSLLNNALATLNYFRYVTHLPQVQLSDELNENAQYGAVVMAANNEMSHYPTKPADMDDAFYEQGYAATGSSNLSYNYGYSDAFSLQLGLIGCLQDADSYNISRLGHRRWLLNPQLLNVGFGYARSATGENYSLTKVFDSSGAAVDYDFVAFPASGNFPIDLFDGQVPWSVSLNPAKFQTPSLSQITVTLTRQSDGKVWSFDASTGAPTSTFTPCLGVDTDYYGIPNCIIFNPGYYDLSSYIGAYSVEIRGLKTRDGSDAKLAYEVNFFDAEENPVPHTHSYTGVTTAPTCTERGYMTYTCDCGDSYVGDYVAALGHAYDNGKVTTDPGCETEGVKTYTCANDSAHTYTETIPPTGHSYGDWYTTKTATVEAEGEERRDCENCGIFETRVVEKLPEPVTEPTEPAPHTHTYTAAVTAPTCTQRGYTTYTCDCGDSYVGNYVNALGHAYDTGVVTTAPGCETEGVKTYTCANDSAHTYTESIPATGHGFKGWYIETVATMEADGEARRDCADCDVYESRVIPKLTREGTPGMIRTEGASVRSEPSTEGEIIGSYRYGTIVTTYETRDGWIRTGEGWVWAENVDTEDVGMSHEERSLREKLANGETEILIDADITLTEDLYIPEYVAVTVDAGGSLTVPAGVTLDVGGWLTVFDGELTVKKNGILNVSNENWAAIDIWGGSLDVTGANISGVPENAIRILLNSSTVRGIPDRMLYGDYLVESTADVNTALAAASRYGYMQLDPSASFTLTNSITLPEDCLWNMYFSAYEITVPSGVKVTNNGDMWVQNGNLLIFEKGSQLINNGYMYIDPYSEVLMFGQYQDNGYIEGYITPSSMPQSDLENFLNQNDGYGWIHSTETTLERNLTINIPFGLYKYGKLVVTDGVTLTLNDVVYLYEGTEIIVEDGGKLVVNGPMQNDGTVTILDGGTLEINAAWEGNDPIYPHTHSYTKTITKPTCTERGYTTYTCECGESYVDNYVEAIGHAYDGGTVTTAPGCVTEGVKTFACANDASHTYTETIPAVGHTTGEWKSNETNHWHECAACGEKLDEAAHNANPCTICGYESITEGDHPYSLGDVNHDGKINAKDSTLILQYSVGVLKDTTKFCETCANVNGDSKLNAKDATMILQYSVGLRTDF